MANDPIYGSMSPETIKKFKSWQMRTIVVSMIGYAIFYFVRKNFSIAMPGLTAEYGISPINYMISCRIDEAKHLLKNGDYSLAVISHTLGFSSPSYFSQTFRKLTNMSPNEYRKTSRRRENTP